MGPFQPPSVSRSEILRANRIAGTRRDLGFSFLGRRLALAFGPGAPSRAPALTIGVKAGGREFLVGIEDFLFRDAIRDKAAGVDLAELPGPVAAAVVESLLEDLLNGLDAWAGGTSQVLSVALGPGAGTPENALPLTLTGGSTGSPATGFLAAAEADLEWLAQRLDGLPPARARMADLPFPVAFELGETSLPLADLKALGVLDIVLLDRSAWPSGAGARVRVGNVLCFQGTLEDARVRVEDFMADEAGEQQAGTRPKKAASLDELDVKLVFEVGSLSVTLEKLSAVQAGYTFELANPTGRPVTIRANGKVIGAGELLDVEGRIGVRVLELFEHAGR